jgi:hypothetical protein
MVKIRQQQLDAFGKNAVQGCPLAAQKAPAAGNATPTAPTRADLDAFRTQLKVPETHTIAIGKTDIPGLENAAFRGASPLVRKEAGLPSLDESMPGREIKSPSPDVRGTRHAEEGVLNEFNEAVKKARLTPEQVKGTLYVHQSNPKGICSTCIQGIANPDVDPGIFLQLSKKYPNLTIKASSETVDGVKASGRLSFTLLNGKMME